jgi:hypothetical protein
VELGSARARDRLVSHHRHRCWSAPRRGSVPSSRQPRCAAYARIGACGCRVSRPATRLVHTAAGLCCRPAAEPLLSNSDMDLQDCGAAAQGRVIRHRQIKPQKLKDRANQALRLTQRQPEHRPQRQRCPDRQSRIVGLTTACGAGLGPPGGNRLIGEPDREASALAQGRVILGPIRDPVPLLRNAVTVSGIGFE